MVDYTSLKQGKKRRTCKNCGVEREWLDVNDLCSYCGLSVKSRKARKGLYKKGLTDYFNEK